jgi:uncharacterized protein (TIGR00269 family)
MEQSYSGLSLCKNCFTEQFEGRVKKANREFGLLRRGDRIAVGVSGGKDSGAMLYTLNKLCKKIGDIELIPVLVDEGIIGYRDKSAECARALCELLGLDLVEKSFAQEFGLSMDDIAARERKRPSCSYCGVLRKRVLNKTAQELGANKIAVGHTADDVAQTFLMNLLRNEPARIARFGSANGFERESSSRRITPLIYCLEEECALYCGLQEIPFHAPKCPYSVEAFRGEAEDFLNELEKKHLGAKYNVVNAFLSIKNALEFAEKEKLKKEERSQCTCISCGQPSSKKLCKACELLAELRE